MRLFLAAEVPASAKYAEVTRDLRAHVPRAHPVPEASWHVTLNFLGEVPSPEPVVKTAAAVSSRFRSAPLAVRGVGAFPSQGRARIAWAGASCQTLEPLAKALGAAIPGQGADKEFHAHVTLARIDPPADVRAWCAAHAGASFGEGVLAEVALFRSDLGPGGPRYTKLAALPLQPA